MKTVEQRRREREAQNQAERTQRKRNKAPVNVTVAIGAVEYTMPLSAVYAPILKTSADTRLADMAEKYQLPLTQEQRYLVEVGDTFLPQYDKVNLTENQMEELYLTGWSPLVSSNIRAVRIQDEDLLIQFHNDSVYLYPEMSEMYYPFNEALSPGRLLWRTIRTMRGYRKIS